MSISKRKQRNPQNHKKKQKQKQMPIPEMSSSSKNPLRGAVEVIKNRLYYCALKEPLRNHKILIRNPHANSHNNDQKIPVLCFNIDDELVYWNFFLDFGPLNLGQLHRFTTRLNGMLAQAKRENTTVLFYSSTHSSKRANAIFLICAWQILELNRSPTQAIHGFSTAAYNNEDNNKNNNNNNNNNNNININRQQISSSWMSHPPLLPLSAIGKQTINELPPFHDASPYPCPFHLTLVDCLDALVKARQFNFFDWGDDFDVKEYEYFEQVENGDLNWIVKGKILAFAGPSYTKTISPEGYCTLSPNDYIPYFQRKNVGLVVRLNQKNYEEQQFIDNGMDHLEEFYTDGSCPPMSILRRVVGAFEKVPHDKGFAVHCKAGLGRTGTCIGAYLMKHYRFTAKEVVGWMRICRPGMVIGPQQQFLQDLQPIMWQEGDLIRSLHKLSATATVISDSINKEKQLAAAATTVVPSSPSSRSTSTATTAPESPTSVVLATTNSKEAGHEVILGGHGEHGQDQDQERVEGRPGQAAGLLAARHRQKTSSSPPHSPPHTSNDNNEGSNDQNNTAVPVTPDNKAVSSSMWARAFA